MTGHAIDGTAAALCEALGYTFDDASLLMAALTHSSFRNEQPTLAPVDNERLEYLGDAVLGLVVASLLSERFPDASEGELTRGRADLVSEAGLASIARSVSLGDALRLGKGEEKSGGRNKPRLLASAFEACVGAIFRDGGFDETEAVLVRLLAPRLKDFTPGAGDYKSRAQEWAQAHEGHAPTYRLVDTTGPDHNRTFTVALLVKGREIATGVGGSKIAAEQDAARASLEKWETS